jgi:hypothetical protein
MRMNTRPDGSVKIALIMPEEREAVWIEELLLIAGVPADVVRVDPLGTFERSGLGDAEIIFIRLQILGAPEKEVLANLHAVFPRIPLVVLADADASSWAGEAVRLGAQHVLIKSRLTSERLSSTIRYYAYYVSDRNGPAADAWSRPMIPAAQFAHAG